MCNTYFYVLIIYTHFSKVRVFFLFFVFLQFSLSKPTFCKYFSPVEYRFDINFVLQIATHFLHAHLVWPPHFHVIGAWTGTVVLTTLRKIAEMTSLSQASNVWGLALDRALIFAHVLMPLWVVARRFWYPRELKRPSE